MEPWYKVVTPRKEVREGRSFNPDEFAIALEQVVSGSAPEDYRVPEQFFARTCFTRALREHAGIVLRRLAGQTKDTAPVLTLITQFGGGKTHTLATLYHLGTLGEKATAYQGVSELLRQAGLSTLPQAKVAVFVGNAWDPQPGRETPWLDIARQLAGDRGVEALGTEAKTTPPGTEALARVFQAAEAPVLLLFDEVLNFLNRHRKMAESFHAFIQNLTVAATGTSKVACVISLPRSQVEMTPWDQEWQEKITKVVRRVAKDLIANDEAEISEVVRRRLFENIGTERVRKQVALAYADWCFERRHQLPPEWTTVDAARGRAALVERFEACYPFHPATLSVFQRKWQALPQYQQTRGTLAMLAQWISVAAQDSFKKARNEPLITLGSAPLLDLGFRSAVLGQLGESRLEGAIRADIAGEQAHARALDADSKGALRDVHQRVGAAILFESSGGQTEKVAHAPELRFALGGPEVDTTSVDTAALALEGRSYFIRRVGADGYKIGHTATLKKVVNDRRASLDDESDVRPALKKLVEEEFRRGASVPLAFFPTDGTAISDSPKLTLVILEPESAWSGNKTLRERLASWTRLRGQSPRLYPAALVWCAVQPGRDLREKVEWWLAWKRVRQELSEGVLGVEHDPAERADVQAKLKDAEEAAKDAVWAAYRFVVIEDHSEGDGIQAFDLAPGHSSGGESLCGRVLTALRNKALLNESVGVGYLERNWPPAFKESGAWPLAGLRQSFLNGSLTRLLDPDAVLRNRLVECVAKGDFGLASGLKPDGAFERLWFQEGPGYEEFAFEPGVFLLTKAKAQELQGAPKQSVSVPVQVPASSGPWPAPEALPAPGASPVPAHKQRTLRISGDLPPEAWNRLGTKLLPKLRTAGLDLKANVAFAVTVDGGSAEGLVAELRLALEDLGLTDKLKIE